MTKQMSDHRSVALHALESNAPKGSFGEFIEDVQEDETSRTYFFENKLEGYRGWRWAVTLSWAESGEPTVSEVLLLPSEGAILAPNWVPWSERLAEWKAMQAELEAAAEAEAAENGEVEETNENEWTETAEAFEAEEVEHDLAHEEAHVLEEESATTDSEESEDSEADAKNAGKRPPRFSRRNRGRGQKKNK